MKRNYNGPVDVKIKGAVSFLFAVLGEDGLPECKHDEVCAQALFRGVAQLAHAFLGQAEFAESVLLHRDSDSRDKVSMLLNLTDGIMGDSLGLQIICTMNGAINEMDAALLRPGRLQTHREFRALQALEAARLAAFLGKPLPAGKTATLAELFASASPAVTLPSNESRRKMGFHTVTF